MADDHERERLQKEVRMRYGAVSDADWVMDPVMRNFLDGTAYYIEYGPGDEDYCYALASNKTDNVDVYSDGIEVIKAFQALLEKRRSFIQRLGDFNLFDLVAAVIALAVTTTVIIQVFIHGQLGQELAGIFGIILGYYFGKTVGQTR